MRDIRTISGPNVHEQVEDLLEDRSLNNYIILVEGVHDWREIRRLEREYGTEKRGITIDRADRIGRSKDYRRKGGTRG